MCTIVNGGISIERDNRAKNDGSDGVSKGNDTAISNVASDVGTNTNKGSPESNAVGASAHNNNAKPPKRFVTPDELPAFCAAIEGSCLTKIALVEELKRK